MSPTNTRYKESKVIKIYGDLPIPMFHRYKQKPIFSTSDTYYDVKFVIYIFIYPRTTLY